MIWHEYKYLPWIIDPFPGHTHSKDQRVNPLDSKSHWLNTFHKYFPPYRGQIKQRRMRCISFKFNHGTPSLVCYMCRMCVRTQHADVGACVCLCISCPLLAGEGKWLGALPAKSQCFSRKTNDIVPGADTSFTAKSLPAGLKFQPCKGSRSGAGALTKDDIGL